MNENSSQTIKELSEDKENKNEKEKQEVKHGKFRR